MARIITALQILALSTSTFAIACGDGERQLSASPSLAETGGNESDAGKTSTHAGGNSSVASGTTSGGAVTSDAGTAGGDSSVVDSGAAGGASSGGTSSSVGGTNPDTSSTAGSSATGGSSNTGSAVGGASSTGTQSSTGGTSATSVGGTLSTGGDTSSGGVSTAGGASSSTGGANTGGVATGGTSAAMTCVASYVAPTNNQALANADDLNGTCSDGIQFNVVVATNAPEGTPATLSLALGSGETTQIADATVSSAVARFNNVTLPASGQVTLTAAIGGTACSASEALSLSCAGAPGCTITSPTITTAHPALNGVAATQGDRVSSVGSPYQVAFEISTDAQDGQPVVLTVDGSTNYQTTASAGKATFGGILMVPDGNHTARAMCTARSGLSSTTTLLTFPVDTVAPDLMPQKGTGIGGSTIGTLNNGDHYPLTDDADLGTDGLQIRVCGATTATDAVDIASANSNASNFCVKRGTSASACAAVNSANTNSAGHFACVNIDCPGEGPFSLDLSMSDAAGNPTVVTRTGITCASTSPTVNIVDPKSDSGSFSDISRRILAADNNNTETVRKDKNAGKAGAQYDVVACTTAPAGSTAVLYTGYKGQSLNQTATTTVTADSVTTPVCSGGNLITFSSSTVTLPESLTNSSFNILTPTELKVTVTDLNLATGSDVADVWVDSVSPSLALVTPSPFCGQYFDTSGTGSTTASVSMKFGSSLPVVVSVAGPSGTQTFSNNTVVFSQVTVGVQLEAGTDTVSARSTKPSTNYGSYPACDVTVGDTPPPSVSWQTPVNSSLLTATGNSGTNKIPDDNAATGWQGTLKVCTNVDVATYSTATVTFTAAVGTAVTTIGSANIVADGTCPTGKTSSATLTGATVPEGNNVLLTATTSTIGDSAGTASITVPVSSTLPGQATITGVDITDRRKTSFTPKWTAPSGSVAGYKVRVSKTQITSQSDFDGALDILYSGSGTCPTGGCSVLVDKCSRVVSTGATFNCYIENDYYFAVAPVDGVGNMGQFVATTTATTAHFIQTDLQPVVVNQRFGYILDGTGDLNKDGFSDLIISYAAGNEVDIFFGSSAGVSSSPAVRIQSTVNQFGYSVAAIGDINGDEFEDLAIGSPNDGNGVVRIFYGRSTEDWNATPTLSAASADVTIDTSAAADARFNLAAFGNTLARIGDFNDDKVDDVAIGAANYNNHAGLVVVILGKSGGLPGAISLPSAFDAQAMRISGDAAGGTYFGNALVGAGPFYGGSNYTSLVVSAPGVGSTGRLYSFVGVSGSTADLSVSNARNTVDGLPNEFIGAYAINPLGNIGPGGQAGFGIYDSYLSPTRAVAWSGSSTGGPFAGSAAYTSSESSSTAFGRAIYGSGMSGRSTSYSFIGTTNRSDIAISTRANSKPRLYIVDGDKVSSPSTATVESLADVVVSLTGSFADFASFVTGIPDIDGDGYGDLIAAETDYSSKPISGHVVVLR